MYSQEENIRNHFRKFSVEDIADSVHFYGLDFDNDSIDKIMQSLDSLYEEVTSLRSMIDRNFQSEIKTLMPNSPEIQTGIIQDCYKKESALLKALSNQDVINAFLTYRKNKENAFSQTK